MTTLPTPSVVPVDLPGMIYGGTDYPITLTFAVGELAEGDKFHIDWRTSLAGREVGRTTSDDAGDVILDVLNNRAVLVVRHAKTEAWFAKEVSELDETTRIIPLVGTYVHTDAAGRTKGASGLLELRTFFYVGLTRRD